MKNIRTITIISFVLLTVVVQGFGQSEGSSKVVISGDKLAYPLLEKWMEEYQSLYPGVDIQLDEKAGLDADLFLQSGDEKEDGKREYFSVARYAILPVAHVQAEFSGIYADKGLSEDLIKQVFFDDIYAERKKKDIIETPYTVYTRLGSHGIPALYASYFGYGVEQIKGNAIVGTDFHVVKAMLRDNTSVSFNSLNLIYDPATGKINEGLVVLPPDLNGNGKVTDDEKFYDNLEQVIAKLQTEDLKKVRNIPIADVKLSVNPDNDEAVKFLVWVLKQGQETANQYGFLKAEESGVKAALEKVNRLLALR